MVFDLPGRQRPYIMAHRGNLVACPENTLAAFRRALVTDGADILETDLHVSADGVFVCIHDETVNRTTDGSGPVAGKTLAELRQLSASYGRPEFREERIPTLAEVFELMPPDRALALELKSDAFCKPEVAERLAAQIAASGMAERVVLLSFQMARVEAVSAHNTHIPIGLITMKRLAPSRQAALLGPFWPLLVLNPLYVWWAHALGKPVAPLDPTPEGRLWYYRLLGVDAVLSNDPGKTARALGR